MEEGWGVRDGQEGRFVELVLELRNQRQELGQRGSRFDGRLIF